MRLVLIQSKKESWLKMIRVDWLEVIELPKLSARQVRDPITKEFPSFCAFNLSVTFAKVMGEDQETFPFKGRNRNWLKFLKKQIFV